MQGGLGMRHNITGLDEKSKHALLGKHRHSTVAIRYKVAGYV